MNVLLFYRVIVSRSITRAHSTAGVKNKVDIGATRTWPQARRMLGDRMAAESGVNT